MRSIPERYTQGCALTLIGRPVSWESTFYPATGEDASLKYLVGGHLADRVTSLQRLQLLQTPVQLVQGLDGQLLVGLLCSIQTQHGIVGNV